MQNTTFFKRCGPLLGLLSTMTVAAHAETVILSNREVEITFEEAFAYSLRHTNPTAYEASLSKPQATFRVLQNLYVLKRVARHVEGTDLVSVGDREYLRDDLYRRALLERFLEDEIAARMAGIDWEGLAKAEYAQRKSNLKSPEEVRAEHLLVSIEGIPFDAFVSRVRAVQEALATGADFGALITEYSDDPSSARNGGDLGFFSRQRMQPTFSEAAFNLVEPGDITGPVMTRFGAHFIRLIDRRGEQTLPFDHVKAGLIDEIRASTKIRLREELLGNFRAEIESELAEIDEPELVRAFLKVYEAKQAATD